MPTQAWADGLAAEHEGKGQREKYERAAWNSP